MKKLIPFLLVFCTLVCLAGCRGSKEAPYDRSDYKQEYERLFRRNVFAQCENMGTFYATYCLARLDQKPHGEDPRYKVTFLRGPLKGKTVLTRRVITKTLPVDAGPLPKGMVVLRNFDNPRNAYDTEHLDRWHLAVVHDTTNADKGHIELEFPRDANDFMAARESIYLHNIRYIVKPEVKDIRVWL